MSERVADIGCCKFLAELGRSPTGIVYRAQDLHSNRFVACKVLTPGKRWLPEVHAMTFADPNIPAAYQSGEDRGQRFYIREFIDGANLKEKIETGAISAMSAAKVLGVIAGAVGRIHERGIIHRNLLPENVLVAKDGTPKLIGFGRVCAIYDMLAPPGTTAELDVRALQAMLAWVFLERGETLPGGLEPACRIGSVSSAAELARLIAQGTRS